MQKKKPKVYNVSARGDLGHSLDLIRVAQLITEADYNEGFKGGRVEIEIVEEETKIGKIQVYSSGKYIIICNNLADIYLADDIFCQLIVGMNDSKPK